MCGVGAGFEYSSPVLAWILGDFWILPRGVSPRLEWGHARVLSSRAVAAVSGFPSRASRDLCLFLESFPRSFPTRLSHRSVTRATVVSVYPRLESRGSEGKTDFPEWTEISGGLWEWWHNPGVPLAFPVESAYSLDATGTPGIPSRPRRERNPPLELGGGNGAPLDVGGTLVLPLEWRRVF